MMINYALVMALWLFPPFLRRLMMLVPDVNAV
jgi:hypothetical protein